MVAMAQFQVTATLQGSPQRRALMSTPAAAFEHENKATIRRVIEEVYNQGNLAVADELYTANAVLMPRLRLTFPEDRNLRNRSYSDTAGLSRISASPSRI